MLGGAATGELLLSEPMGAVSFTGSTAVGHLVRDRATPLGAKVQLELGGKNMAIVLDDADVSVAQDITRAAFGFAGQKCTATSVVLAAKGIHDDLQAALIEATHAVPWGKPSSPEVWGGPLINPRQREIVDGMVKASVSEGAEVVAMAPTEDRPTVVAPTLIRSNSPDVMVAREEVFGPVLTILDVTDASAFDHRQWNALWTGGLCLRTRYRKRPSTVQRAGCGDHRGEPHVDRYRGPGASRGVEGVGLR